MNHSDQEVLDRYHRRFAALDALVPQPAASLFVAGAVPRARPRAGQHQGRGLMPALVLLVVILAVATLSVFGGRWLDLASGGTAGLGNGAGNATGLMVTLGPTVTVPASWVRPVDECLHEAGFIAIAVHPAVSGSNAKYGYSWESPTYFSWTTSGVATQGATEALQTCSSEYATDQPKSDDEIRVIYDRWVLERRCLMDFGYTPTAPPSLAEFLTTWTTGPWLPVDGIGVPSPAAEATCGLEMLR